MLKRELSNRRQLDIGWLGADLRNVFFSYDDEGPMILKDISCKIGLTSRVGIVGANGAGGV